MRSEWCRAKNYWVAHPEAVIGVVSEANKKPGLPIQSSNAKFKQNAQPRPLAAISKSAMSSDRLGPELRAQFIEQTIDERASLF
jgi:hypothetical protein